MYKQRTTVIELNFLFLMIFMITFSSSETDIQLQALQHDTFLEQRRWHMILWLCPLSRSLMAIIRAYGNIANSTTELTIHSNVLFNIFTVLFFFSAILFVLQIVFCCIHRLDIQQDVLPLQSSASKRSLIVKVTKVSVLQDKSKSLNVVHSHAWRSSHNIQ